MTILWNAQNSLDSLVASHDSKPERDPWQDGTASLVKWRHVQQISGAAHNTLQQSYARLWDLLVSISTNRRSGNACLHTAACKTASLNDAAIHADLSVSFDLGTR